MMAETKGKENKDSDYLESLYQLIAEVFGQKKITPMALVKMVVRNKGTGIIKDPSVKLVLNETCNFDKAKEYAKEKYYKDCHNFGSKSPCCGYFGTMASEKSILNLTLLSLKYALPNLIYTHEPLADFLGLPYEHIVFSSRIGKSIF